MLGKKMPAKKTAEHLAPICPCGSAMFYAQCCERWHAGAAAPTAEQLMRSRYCAYALKLDDYLRDTWHPDTRPGALNLRDDSTRWLGLKIIASGSIDGDLDYVEFIARYKSGGGAAQRLHERSRFTRIGERWFYLDGQFLE